MIRVKAKLRDIWRRLFAEVMRSRINVNKSEALSFSEERAGRILSLAKNITEAASLYSSLLAKEKQHRKEILDESSRLYSFEKEYVKSNSEMLEKSLKQLHEESSEKYIESLKNTLSSMKVSLSAHEHLQSILSEKNTLWKEQKKEAETLEERASKIAGIFSRRPKGFVLVDDEAGDLLGEVQKTDHAVKTLMSKAEAEYMNVYFPLLAYFKTSSRIREMVMDCTSRKLLTAERILRDIRSLRNPGEVSRYLRELSRRFPELNEEKRGIRDMLMAAFQPGRKKEWDKARKLYRRLWLAHHKLNEYSPYREKHLLSLATIDSLTGLGNVRMYHSALKELIYRYIRDETEEVAYVLIDLDNFKKVNDSMGHHEGDEVLKRFAKILGKNTRKGSDRLFRIGGDEFIVLLELREGRERSARHEEEVRTILGRIENEFKRNFSRLNKRLKERGLPQLSLSAGWLFFSTFFEEFPHLLPSPAGERGIRVGKIEELLKNKADSVIYPASKEKERGKITQYVAGGRKKK